MATHLFTLQAIHPAFLLLLPKLSHTHPFTVCLLHTQRASAHPICQRNPDTVTFSIPSLLIHPVSHCSCINFSRSSFPSHFFSFPYFCPTFQPRILPFHPLHSFYHPPTCFTNIANHSTIKFPFCLCFLSSIAHLTFQPHPSRLSFLCFIHVSHSCASKLSGMSLSSLL